MTSLAKTISLWASVLLLAACGHSPISQAPIASEDTMTLEQTAQWAQIDYANKVETDLENVAILEAREVVWSSGAIGCPRPDGFYTQALVEGHLIVIAHGENLAHYHSRKGQRPFLCPEDRRAPPIQMNRTIY